MDNLTEFIVDEGLVEQSSLSSWSKEMVVLMVSCPLASCLYTTAIIMSVTTFRKEFLRELDKTDQRDDECCSANV